MNKFLTKIATAMVGIAMAVGVGVSIGTREDARVARADSYTITFANNASSAQPLPGTTNASTVIKDDGSRSYVTTKPFIINSGNCYYGDTKTCIRIGKSQNAASLTIALSDAGKVKATSIVVNCHNIGGKNAGASLNVNSIGQQTTDDSTATDMTFTFATPTDITNIVLEGTKAIRIYSITVNYGDEPAAELIGIRYVENVLTQSDYKQGESWNHDGLEVEGYDENNDSVEIVTSNIVWTYTFKGVSSESAPTEVGETGSLVAIATYGEFDPIESASKSITVIQADKGTRYNPYTVAEAIEVIDGSTTAKTDKYVEGIICQVDTYGSNAITYWISDDGTTTTKMEVYKGKGLNGANFTSKDDLLVGDEVIVHGAIKHYSNFDEFDQYSELVSFNRPEAELESIAIDGDMTKTTGYTSKNSSWNLGGLSVVATYSNTAQVDVTSEVEWSYNVASPSAVDFGGADEKTFTLEITATYEEFTDDYSVSVTVTNSGIQIHEENAGYEHVTDDSTLKANDVLVIGSGAQGKTAGAISSSIMAVVVSTFNADHSMITSLGAGTVKLILGGSSGSWTLSNEDEELLGATAVKKVAWDAGTTTWDIDIDSNGNATIQNGTSSYGRFLHNVNDTRFTTYTSATNASMLLPQLYRQTGIYDVDNDLLTAVSNFNTDFTCDDDGITFDVTNWNGSASEFTSEIQTKYHLNLIAASASGNVVEKFLSMYDYVIAKKEAGYTAYADANDFLGRYGEGGIHENDAPVLPTSIMISSENNSMMIVTVISIISVTAVGGYFLLRKKKED